MDLTLTYHIEPAGVIALAILFALYFLFKYALSNKKAKHKQDQSNSSE